MQTVDDGAIVDPAPDQLSPAAIFVRNLPPGIGDTETFALTAKLYGSYSYINRNYDSRTIRAYDTGLPVKRADIPDAIAKEGKAWAKATHGRAQSKSILAQLPGSSDLASSGSGFFITEDGYLLTNFHVVEDAVKVRIKTSTAVHEAKVIATDEKRDLALLKVEGQFKALSIAAEDAELGTAVFTIGFPNFIVQGLEPKYTDGKISSLSSMRDDPDNYQISVPIQPGNSGGPLMDSSGRVVGVIVAKLGD